jgi:hypothetical protein
VICLRVPDFTYTSTVAFIEAGILATEG